MITKIRFAESNGSVIFDKETFQKLVSFYISHHKSHRIDVKEDIDCADLIMDFFDKPEGNA